jgi:hypothetical protein
VAFSALCAAQSFTVHTVGVEGKLEVRPFLPGSSGAYGPVVRDAGTDGVYRIPLRPEGVYTFDFAKTLKAILWAPGCQIELVSRDLVSDFTRDALYECHPLRTVTLSGMVSPPPATGGPLEVEVHYLANWDHGFFGIGDGPVTDLFLAKVPLDTSGRFTAKIPDFSQDPVTKQKQSASLKLIVVDSNSGNLRASTYLKVQPRYDSEIRFTVR